MVIWSVRAKLEPITRMALRSRWWRWIVRESILMHLIAEEAEGDVGDEDEGKDEDEREYLGCLVSIILRNNERG